MARFADGSTQDVTTNATWESSRPSTATVAGGLVTVLSDGDVDIHATYQGTGGSVHLDVALPKGHTLTGFVVDARTSKPIAGVRVQLVGGTSTRTDDNGSFGLAVTNERALVEFSKDGYQFFERDVTISGDVQILVSMTPVQG